MALHNVQKNKEKFDSDWDGGDEDSFEFQPTFIEEPSVSELQLQHRKAAQKAQKTVLTAFIFLKFSGQIKFFVVLGRALLFWNTRLSVLMKLQRAVKPKMRRMIRFKKIVASNKIKTFLFQAVVNIKLQRKHDGEYIFVKLYLLFLCLR